MKIVFKSKHKNIIRHLNKRLTLANSLLEESIYKPISYEVEKKSLIIDNVSAEDYNHLIRKTGQLYSGMDEYGLWKEFACSVREKDKIEFTLRGEFLKNDSPYLKDMLIPYKRIDVSK